jgi:hypothetical protein
VPRDFYKTPYEAVLPLIPFLHPDAVIDEPCAGDGALVKHLQRSGFTTKFASDIEPRHQRVQRLCAFERQRCFGNVFVTNPPWDRKVLHPLILHLSDIAPTWLLFDSDWCHTKQSKPYMERCEKIISIGRVKWIPDSKMTGKDNCCWFFFNKPSSKVTRFIGR